MGLFSRKIKTVKRLYKCPQCGFEKIIEEPDPMTVPHGIGQSAKLVKMAEKAHAEAVCPKCGLQMVAKGA